MVNAEEFVERLCRLGAGSAKRGFPRKRADREILIKSFRLLLDGSRSYTEREINARLQAWKRDVIPAIETDHVTLRRMLVDHGHLERTADGHAYRVGFPARPFAFALEVDDVDVRATVAAYREYLAKRPRRTSP